MYGLKLHVCVFIHACVRIESPQKKTYMDSLAVVVNERFDRAPACTAAREHLQRRFILLRYVGGRGRKEFLSYKGLGNLAQ